MTADDIISSLNVIKYYNPSMATLYDEWIEQAANIDPNRTAVVEAEEAGVPIYETLVDVEVELANACHNYVFNITHPFDSIMLKANAREQLCRDIFGLPADF